MDRRLALVGGVMAFTAVALGAFGAHGLKALVQDLPDSTARLAWWETGARYHFFHALAVCLAAVLRAQTKTRASDVAAWFFVVGTLLFAGSLYVMAATGVRGLGAVTPLGGVSYLAGWLSFLWAGRSLPTRS